MHPWTYRPAQGTERHVLGLRGTVRIPKSSSSNVGGVGRLPGVSSTRFPSPTPRTLCRRPCDGVLVPAQVLTSWVPSLPLSSVWTQLYHRPTLRSPGPRVEGSTVPSGAGTQEPLDSEVPHHEGRRIGPEHRRLPVFGPGRRTTPPVERGPQVLWRRRLLLVLSPRVTSESRNPWGNLERSRALRLSLSPSPRSRCRGYRGVADGPRQMESLGPEEYGLDRRWAGPANLVSDTRVQGAVTFEGTGRVRQTSVWSPTTPWYLPRPPALGTTTSGGRPPWTVGVVSGLLPTRSAHESRHTGSTHGRTRTYNRSGHGPTESP